MYCGSHRWLLEAHPYQHLRNKKYFDNKVELKLRPPIPKTDDILTTTWREVGHAHGAQGDPSKNHGVKQRSVLYNLTLR